MPSTFTTATITPSRQQSGGGSPDVSVPLIFSKFVDMTNITNNTFMAVVDSDFRKSSYFQNSPKLPELDFSKLALLAPGDEQILIFSADPNNLSSNRSQVASAQFLAAGSYVSTVNGNKLAGVDGNSSDIVLGKSNQKVYNGATAYFDGPAFRAYDKLITTYEHASVIEVSEHNDTIYHFGELDVLRRGDENLVVHGQAYSQTFGNTDQTVIGNFTTISETFALEKYDSVMTVKSVEGIKVETNGALAVTSLAGAETNVNGLSLVVSLYEALLSLLDGKIELAALDAVAGCFGTEGFAAKAFGLCVRAGAAVFGIIRI